MHITEVKITAIVLLAASLGTCAFLYTSGASAEPTPNPPREAASVSTSEAKPVPEHPRKEEKEESPLSRVLSKWAESDENIHELRVNCTKTATDSTFNEKTLTKGEVFVKKPDLGRVDWRDPDGRLREIWLLESKRLHHFDFEAKTEWILAFPIAMPTNRQANGLHIVRPATFLEVILKGVEDQVRWSIFGPQARDISSHFNVRLAKQDQWYIYLDITPRNRDDKKWLNRGRVVLHRKTYWVRQLWWEDNRGDTVLMDYLDMRTNSEASSKRETLLKGLPKGWK